MNKCISINLGGYHHCKPWNFVFMGSSIYFLLSRIMKRGHEGHLARAWITNGPQAQRMYKFQHISMVRLSSTKDHILWTLSWIAGGRNCFKIYMNFDSLGCFLLSPLNCLLSACLLQWLQVNTLSICCNMLANITIQLRYKVVWLVSSRPVSIVTLYEIWIFFRLLIHFSEK